MSTVETVGVLLVHGIGEQRRFEHLTGEVRHLIAALEALPGVRRVSVSVNSSRDAHYLADTELWRGDREAPVRLDVDFGSRRVEVHVREVWWADLDEPPTLRSQIAFWAWGLYQWAAKPFKKSRLAGARTHMRLPDSPGGTDRAALLSLPRLRLLAVSTVFLLALLSLELINFVLRRFLMGHIPGSDVLVRYLGDVKLFQQRARARSGPVGDMNQPPRVAIRRRMVSAMVDVALAEYDRSYVLAHSLGTVLAWNGLMESAHCLPNYLDRERWERCLAAGIGQAVDPRSPLLGDTDDMRPPRPVWLEDNHVIDRERLFERFKGFLTYGSPLDKFAFLWPNIVPINKDNEAPFPAGFQWINVYDNTDPVGASLEAFDPKQSGDGVHAVASPRNFSFAAFPVLLLSHIRYLHFKPEESRRLVNRVAQWLASGKGFPEPVPGRDAGWLDAAQQRRRTLSRTVQWVVFTVLLAGVIGWLVEPAVASGWRLLFGSGGEVVSYQCAPAEAGSEPLSCQVPAAGMDVDVQPGTLSRIVAGIPFYIGTAALVVLIIGLLGRWREGRKEQRSDGGGAPEP